MSIISKSIETENKLVIPRAGKGDWDGGFKSVIKVYKVSFCCNENTVIPQSWRVLVLDSRICAHSLR